MNKIDVRCNQCGDLLFRKIVSGVDNRKAEKEFGGIEIKCENCQAINTIILKHDKPAYGERVTYSKKAS
jgi:phage FluMu protein Com